MFLGDQASPGIGEVLADDRDFHSFPWISRPPARPPPGGVGAKVFWSPRGPTLPGTAGELRSPRRSLLGRDGPIRLPESARSQRSKIPGLDVQSVRADHAPSLNARPFLSTTQTSSFDPDGLVFSPACRT